MRVEYNTAIIKYARPRISNTHTYILGPWHSPIITSSSQRAATAGRPHAANGTEIIIIVIDLHARAQPKTGTRVRYYSFAAAAAAAAIPSARVVVGWVGVGGPGGWGGLSARSTGRYSHSGGAKTKWAPRFEIDLPHTRFVCVCVGVWGLYVYWRGFSQRGYVCSCVCGCVSVLSGRLTWPRLESALLLPQIGANLFATQITRHRCYISPHNQTARSIPPHARAANECIYVVCRSEAAVRVHFPIRRLAAGGAPAQKHAHSTAWTTGARRRTPFSAGGAAQRRTAHGANWGHTHTRTQKKTKPQLAQIRTVTQANRRGWRSTRNLTPIFGGVASGVVINNHTHADRVTEIRTSNVYVCGCVRVGVCVCMSVVKNHPRKKSDRVLCVSSATFSRVAQQTERRDAVTVHLLAEHLNAGDQLRYRVESTGWGADWLSDTPQKHALPGRDSRSN